MDDPLLGLMSLIGMLPFVAALHVGGYSISQTADRMNAFGLDLMRGIPRQKGQNRMFSPISANAAMMLLVNGAAGGTERIVRTAMHLPEGPLSTANQAVSDLIQQVLDSPEKEVTLANAVFVPPAMKIGDAYKGDVTHFFGATIEPLAEDEGSAVKQVNGWVDKMTKHRIDRLVDQLGSQALVLANAVTFDGKWKNEFDASMTHPMPFHSETGTQQVATMAQTGSFGYREFAEGAEIELPYKDRRFVMRVMLPNHGDPAKLLVARPNRPEFLNRQVDLTLPKFTFADQMDLRKALTSVGLGILYIGGDFSRLTPGVPKLKVDKAIQKTWIQVDELGTKAAASTGMVMRKSLVMHNRTVFHIDRPFAFEIVHPDTGAILFAGTVYRIGG